MQEKQGVRKYHLVRWLDVCQPKDLGGLAVTNLEFKNTSLLCRWLWCLENENGAWQDIIKAKYLKNVPYCSVLGNLRIHIFGLEFCRLRIYSIAIVNVF